MLSQNFQVTMEDLKNTEIIRKAKDTGANAVKLQTYAADTITLNSNKDDFLFQ